MDRKDTLLTAETCVCGQREKDYGTPKDNFSVIADFWNVYANRVCLKDKQIIFTPHDVAVMMSLMKHGRITSGQPKADNYIDACGYLACASEIATET